MDKENKIKVTGKPLVVTFYPFEESSGHKYFTMEIEKYPYPPIEILKQIIETTQGWLKYAEEIGEKEINHLNESIKLRNRKTFQRMERIEKGIKGIKGYIYVIKSGDLYKIGRTKDIKNRSKKYYTENPYDTELVLSKEVDDYTWEERELQKMFSKKRVKGEWFKLNEYDLDLIISFLDIFPDISELNKSNGE